MQYLDKSTGKVINLQPSATNFLVVAQPGDTEGIHPILLNQRSFSVVQSSNDHHIFLLRPRTDTESVITMGQEIEQLKQDPRIVSVSSALVDAAGNTRFVLPDSVVVQFKNTTDAQATKMLEQAGGTVSRKFQSPGLYEVDVPSGVAVPDFINVLNRLPKVAFAEPEFYGVDDADLKVMVSVRGHGSGEGEGITPDNLGWNLKLIELAAAWQISKGSSDVLVVIVDGLPQLDHEAIATKILAAPDNSLYFSADRSISSHATNVCSTIAGESSRMEGVAPGVHLLPIITNLSSQVYAERADALRAVAALAGSGTFGGRAFKRVVMSCSWRTSGDISVIRTALEEVVKANVLAVFSAGNDGSDGAHFPSDYAAYPGNLGDSVVSVAATDGNDQKASYSNYSTAVTLCAPGGAGLPLDERDILCADLGNSYTYAAGTSISAPHVAAVAALLLSLKPELTAKQLKTILTANADDLSVLNPGYPGKLGAGRVNARKTLQVVAGAEAPSTNPTPAGTGLSGSSGSIAKPGPTFEVKLALSGTDFKNVQSFLKGYNSDLEARTGWRLAAAILQRSNSKVTIDVV